MRVLSALAGALRVATVLTGGRLVLVALQAWAVKQFVNFHWAG